MAEAKKSSVKKPVEKAAKKEPTSAEKWTVKATEKIKAVKDKTAAAVLGYEAGYKAGFLAGKKFVLENQ